MSGILYVIGTDLGDKKYLAPIVKDTILCLDWVLTEHAKRAIDILKFFNIEKKQIIFNKKNELIRSEEVIYRLVKGDNIGLISDAGMPIVSDPGTDLVDLCIEKNIKVKIISGTSSITHALAYSGFPNTPFYFGGFIVPSSARRQRELNLNKLNFKNLYKTNKKNKFIPQIEDYINKTIKDCALRKGVSIFFLNGRYVDVILKKCKEFLPDHTKIAICSELTRDNERIIRGSIEEVNNKLNINPNNKFGEHVLVLYIPTIS